jgi:hypothetical protein
MKKNQLIALALSLPLIASCAGKSITREKAETLLGNFYGITSDAAYSRPTCFTTSTTYASNEKKGTVSHSYDETNLYYHTKSDLTGTTASSTEKIASELYVYVRSDVYYYCDVSLRRYYKSDANPTTLFGDKVAELYDPSSVLDDCFVNTPSGALTKLQGFDNGQSIPQYESYHSANDEALEMETTVVLISGSTSKTHREALSFEKNRFFQRVTTDNGDKTTEIYAWDMVSVTYPVLTDWTEAKTPW